ncbi:MAG: hypothetical protein INR71_03240 [Terriglobus roseus]|nr:hypothetical protein [Terriglobus roseus]
MQRPRSRLPALNLTSCFSTKHLHPPGPGTSSSCTAAPAEHSSGKSDIHRTTKLEQWTDTATSRPPDQHAPPHQHQHAIPQGPPQAGTLPQLQHYALSRAPQPPPGSQYNPHANAFNNQPFQHDPNLDAVSAYVAGPPPQAGQVPTSAPHVADSPSQQLIAAASQANELQEKVASARTAADEESDDGDDDDAGPLGDPGAPAPTSDNADNPMPPPPAGTVYLTRDALLKGCNEHARKYGYAMSIKKSSASGSKTIIVCTREGKPMNNHHLSDATRVRRGRVSKRSGCRMKVAGNRIRRINAVGEEEEVWRLRVIEGQHNHGPDETRLNPIHRKMTEEVKEAIVRGLRRGLKIKRIYEELLAQWPDLAATKQDVRNEVGRIRKAEIDLTPHEADAEAIAAEAQRRREAQAAARAAGVAVTESDKTTIAILRVEKSQLEDELKRTREANEGIATAAMRDENEQLKRDNKRLEKELEKLKRDAIASEVRIDELRNTVDRYMMQAMSAGGQAAQNNAHQSQQQQQPQPPQGQGQGGGGAQAMTSQYSGQMNGQPGYGGQYHQQPPQQPQHTPSTRRGGRVAAHAGKYW